MGSVSTTIGAHSSFSYSNPAVDERDTLSTLCNPGTRFFLEGVLLSKNMRFAWASFSAVATAVLSAEVASARSGARASSAVRKGCVAEAG